MLARIAFRNIFRNSRRTGLTLIVIVFGVVALIFFGGYKEVTFRNLRESTIRNRLGHMQIFQKGALEAKSEKPLEHGLENVAVIRVAIEKDPRVKTTAAQIGLTGLISNGEKSVTFLGTAVEPERDRPMGSQRMVAGKYLSDGESDDVIVGKGLAESLNVKPGDYLTLMTTTVTGSLNAADVRVAGIFATGVTEYDDRAVKIPLAGAQRLLQTAKVEKLLVMLRDTADTAPVRHEIEQLVAAKKWPLELRDWSQLATFYHQVVLLYNGIFGFLGMVVFAIVVLSVANTIMMSIFERTREIGTLMSMGTTRSRVWSLFLLEGLFVGILGGVIGLVAGYGLANLVNTIHLQLPPPPGYTSGYTLELLLHAPVLIESLLVAVITSTISAIFPAFKASRMNIVDALGHI
jgi:putative ABC transport system permease protein